MATKIYFIAKKTNCSGQENWSNLILWK